MNSGPDITSQDAAEARAILEGVPGLDLEAGLQVVRGRFAAYLNLLRKYLVLHGGAVEGFQAFLAAEQAGEAQRLVHSLIGAAGFLGASRISTAAQALEQVLRNQGSTGEIQARAEALAAEQTRFCEAIRRLPQVAPTAPSEP
jgi:HPt (histidine-containing phosphotransfer) domain-containing protein